jgi:mannose-6-phosphate isomerase-like protein (cupin superfamily)
LGQHKHTGVEELFYVISGQGSAHVNDETAPMSAGDAVPVHLNDAHSFVNDGTGGLEFLIVGVARQKGNLEKDDPSL